MTDSRDLSELLIEALNDIDEAGGPERHLLRQTIGKDAYSALTSKTKGADLLDRWLAASPKAKPAATKTLALQIARIADRADLVDRIEREIADNFEIEMRGSEQRAPTPSERKEYEGAVNQRRNGQRPATYKKPEGVSLALLAQSPDASRYIKARQNSRH